MTNQEIMELYYGLDNIFKKDDLRFPAKVSFALLRDWRLIDPIIQDLERARFDILSAHGALQEQDGNQVFIPNDLASAQIIEKELDDLFSVENNIDLYKIPISDIENMELSMQELDGLYPILDGED